MTVERRIGSVFQAVGRPMLFGCHAPVLMACLVAAPVHSIELADSAIEMITPVEPNLVVLVDDSGSMDWEVMTSDEGKGGTLFHNQPDGTGGTSEISHRSGCSSYSGTWGSLYGYLYIVYFNANAYRDWKRCNVAADNAWRMRNSDYNPLYFDPVKDYEPWVGVDSVGDVYADMPVTVALEDPWNPGSSTIDLTRKGSLGSNLNGGFRFYTWSDDGDGLFENGEETMYSIGDLDNQDIHDLDALRVAAGNEALGSASAYQQNFANWFSYYRKREYVMKAAMGSVAESVTSARIGFAGINNNGNLKRRVASMNISPNSGNKKLLLDSLYGSYSRGGTPLRQNLRNTGRYFACASGDIFGSGSSSAPGDSDCPVLSRSEGGNCQQNYALLLTDGYYNGGSPSVGNRDANGSGNFDGGAFADTYSDTLADVAMYYYETDLHDDAVLPDEVPATIYDIDRYPIKDADGVSGYPRDAAGKHRPMHQHMSTYTIGFGVTGTVDSFPADPVSAFPWTNPWSGNAEKIDDLIHTAYNGRGLYLSARDHDTLSGALTSAIDAIQAGAGTASAVSFNSQNLRSGSLVFKAHFDTATHAGDLQAFSIDSQGKISTLPVWSAAEMLDTRAGSTSDSRVIVTYKDLGTASSSGAAFQWSDIGGPRSQQGTQRYHLDAIDPPVPVSSSNLGDDRLNWLRGWSVDEGDDYDDGEFRERPAKAGKLGSIVHSTPVFVGQPPYRNRNQGEYPNTIQTAYSAFRTDNADRTPIVYVGANDGMLHGFNAGDGSERFAFIPNQVIPNLSGLTRQDYEQEPFVDLTPSINDAFIEPARGTNRNSLTWNTVLVGGLRAGGKGYFALNITDPEDLDTEAEVAENVMWEFTATNDNRQGYSYSKPLIVMSNKEDGKGNNKWFVLLGNGYNASHSKGEAVLFAVSLEGGLDGDWTDPGDYYVLGTGKRTIPTETLPRDRYQDQFEGQPNGIGGVRAADIDGDGTVDYAYAGDLRGNLYRFDLTDSDPGNWSVTRLFTAKYRTDGSFQPITNTPVVVPHPTGVGVIVVFGTGSWMTVKDASSRKVQSIYGIWDDLGSSISYPLAHNKSSANLVEQAYRNKVNQEHGYVVRTLSDNAIDWSVNKGWYIDLDVKSAKANPPVIEFPGERAIRNFQVRAGISFVNTVIPKSSGTCSGSPGGYQLAFNPQTGGSFSMPVFDLNNDGTFDEQDNVNDAAGPGNVTMGVRKDGDGALTDSAFIDNRRYTQTLDKKHLSIATNTVKEGRRTSWKELFVLD
ncbi:MAG: PilC/PilY family type IV pilus protein [Sedimenticola sp.]